MGDLNTPFWQQKQSIGVPLLFFFVVVWCFKRMMYYMCRAASELMSQKVEASHVSLVIVGTCIGFLFWTTLARQLTYSSENTILNITSVTSP
jgi:hypothetical protein